MLTLGVLIVDQVKPEPLSAVASWINPGAGLPFLFYELPKFRHDEFAVLFDRFVREVAQAYRAILQRSSCWTGGCSERDLKFRLGHLLPWSVAAKSTDFKASQFVGLETPHSTPAYSLCRETARKRLLQLRGSKDGETFLSKRALPGKFRFV